MATVAVGSGHTHSRKGLLGLIAVMVILVAVFLLWSTSRDNNLPSSSSGNESVEGGMPDATYTAFVVNSKPMQDILFDLEASSPDPTVMEKSTKKGITTCIVRVSFNGLSSDGTRRAIWIDVTVYSNEEGLIRLGPDIKGFDGIKEFETHL